MRLSSYASRTDTGHRRRRNEDSLVVRPPLFAVADGMGGAQAGEVASRLAAAALEAEITGDAGEQGIVELVHEANRRVFQRSTEDAATQGMGTTMTVALVDDATGTIAFGHVGDSRAYRVRNDELEQLTDDHSLVGELVRSGRLSREEAGSHPQRSVITRAVGTEPEVDVDTFTVEAEDGDLFLICSDGLTDMVGDDVVREAIVRSGGDLDRAARALVDAANKGGGEDNITVVLFELSSAGDGAIDDTKTLPANLAASSEPDDEDTLSGLEPVTAVDTAVLSADEVRRELARVEADAEPEGESRTRTRSRWLVLLLLLLALAVLAVLVAWGLTR
jgi:serine/threonine protein phosphatase PrpC